MAMTVDESGHDDLALRIDRHACLESLGQLACRAHGHDPVPGDRHGAVLEHATRGIHGDDGATGDQDVDGLACRTAIAGAGEESEAGERGEKY